MTGRECIEAAFSEDGTREIGVVICYESIYIRDRWREVSSRPWWYREAPDLERQLAWRREAIERLGQDWYRLCAWYPRDERQHLWIDQRDGRAYFVDARSDTEEELREPPVGGWPLDGELQSKKPLDPPKSADEVDARLAETVEATPAPAAADGRGDLAARLRAEHAELLPYATVASPLWSCCNLWGFEGLMLRTASDPGLVSHACQRYAESAVQSVADAAAIGATAIWIEECLTDMLNPQAFATINLPALRRITEAIGDAGMKSVYYYCGDPTGKWDLLLDAGADALSLEESKKDFTIDIDDVVDRVGGRCVVFGNLDAIGVLQDGSSAQLRYEIQRQLAAGRRHHGRFVLSLGSPVTPGTPVARVREYCDLTRELQTGTAR